MADGVRLGMMDNPKEQLLSVAMRLWAKAAVGAALPGSPACASSLSLSSTALAESKPWAVDTFLKSE